MTNGFKKIKCVSALAVIVTSTFSCGRTTAESAEEFSVRSAPMNAFSKRTDHAS